MGIPLGKFLKIYRTLKKLFPYKCFSISYVLKDYTPILLQYTENEGRFSLMLYVSFNKEHAYGIVYNINGFWRYIGRMNSEVFLKLLEHSLDFFLSSEKSTLEELLRYRCEKVDGELSEDNRS